MTRSPLFYPLNRGMDAEAGGAADLQTDVMRFMAILSLCLVAIFALVQSIPMAPSPPATSTPEQTAEIRSVASPAERPPSPQPEVIATREIQLTRPRLRQLAAEERPPILQRPKVQKARAAATPATAAPAAPVNEAPVAAAAPPKDGFTLRFENDLALTRLVARNEVGLFAMFPDKSFRMQVNGRQMSFRAASSPEKFHEMDASTVPRPLVDALQRGHGSPGQHTQWGVTIPPGTARQLDQYLRDADGGTLIIDADGDLRLEP